jgi:choloylglycine hydrolase
MCTAIKDAHLFGRTLDLSESYGEQVVISPRIFPFSFTHEGKSTDHHAIIGTAHISGGVPLYYDAMNEKGLCAAALRFPELSHYRKKAHDSINLASFELIPWLLCNFDSAKSAKKELQNINVTDDDFSRKLPATPLHWLIADSNQAFVIESTKDGIGIYDDPYEVLTNAPDFPTQKKLLERCGGLIPGDLSSTSRFIRAVNAKSSTTHGDSTQNSISRFFHVIGTVNQPDGLFKADERRLRTVYTSCMDMESNIYYFTTYDCRRLCGVKMKNADLDTENIISFPMQQKEEVKYLN